MYENSIYLLYGPLSRGHPRLPFKGQGSVKDSELFDFVEEIERVEPHPEVALFELPTAFLKPLSENGKKVFSKLV